MSVDSLGMFGARCDYGFKSRDESGCGERTRAETKNQADFVKLIRKHGWTVARTTNEDLIRYSLKPISISEKAWKAIRPASIYTARCPEHAGHR